MSDPLANFSAPAAPAWRPVYDAWRQRFLVRAGEARQRPTLHKRMLEAARMPPRTEEGWQAVKQNFLDLIRELENPADSPETPPPADRAEEARTAEVLADWSDQPNFPQAPEGNAAPIQRLKAVPVEVVPWPAADQELVDWLKVTDLPPAPIELYRHLTITDTPHWRAVTLDILARGPNSVAALVMLKVVGDLKVYLARGRASL